MTAADQTVELVSVNVSLPKYLGDHRGHPVLTAIGSIIEGSDGLTEKSAGEGPIQVETVRLMRKGNAALRVDEPTIGR